MGIPIPVLFSTLVGLFLLLGAGFVSARANLIPASASAPFTALLMKVALPATIFSAMQRPFDPDFLTDSVMAFLISFALFFTYAGISAVTARLFRVPDGRRGMWMMCCTFCNNGFMGYPVILALFGEEGMALAAMIGIAFNLLVYTLGGKQVLMDVPSGSGVTVSWRKLIFTGVNASTLVGLIFFCLQIPVPDAVMAPIRHLANITTPLSMFLIGMTLAKGKVSEAFRDRDVYTAAFMRLLALPVLTWGILKFIPIISPLAFNVVLIILSMPSPAVSGILAEQYGGNSVLSARIVFLSSLCCIATIPLVALLP